MGHQVLDNTSGLLLIVTMTMTKMLHQQFYVHRALRKVGVFFEDALWDGLGCSGGSTCCELNVPPWFCKTLPSHTITNIIELRSCYGDVSQVENKIITNVDI